MICKKCLKQTGESVILISIYK